MKNEAYTFKQHTSAVDARVNEAVRDVSTQDQDWVCQRLCAFLHEWAGIFNNEFFGGILPTPVVSFERTRQEVLGHFVLGRNDHGLLYNININRRHLGSPEAELLETLVHEQIHLFQYISGVSGTGRYHNLAFVSKAASLGLQVRRGRGCRSGPPCDPFVVLLKANGISFTQKSHWALAPIVLDARTNNPPQRLKRWSCACKSVWTGGELDADCRRCRQHFVLRPTPSRRAGG